MSEHKSLFDKKELRKYMKEKRRNLSETENREKSALICCCLEKLSCIQNADVIFAYMPIQGEVDLTPLFHKVWENNITQKTIALPKAKDKEMEFYAISDFSFLKEGAFGIPEPDTKQCKKIIPKDGDVFLVPGVAFCKDGKRLGYGGGFYDRYFSRYSGKNLLKIGICYDFQIVESEVFKVEEHDISMDGLIFDGEGKCEALFKWR